MLPGKASYMSPEQVRGQGVDHRSDIFSLGIILYELTLCRRLYRGPAEEVMKRIVDEKVTPPTAIRRDFPAALELDRDEARWRSGPRIATSRPRRCAHDLEEFLDESGLRTGNRRLAVYMNELFTAEASGRLRGRSQPANRTAPRARRRAGRVGFRCRAPLGMRIEAAAEEPVAETPRLPTGQAAVPAGPAARQPSPGPAAAHDRPAPTDEPANSVTRGRFPAWFLVAAFIVADHRDDGNHHAEMITSRCVCGRRPPRRKSPERR